MWLRTNRTLINLDRIYYFDSNTQSDKTERVYANSIPICICQPDEVQPLLDAISDALVHNITVFDVPEWLDYHRQHKED